MSLSEVKFEEVKDIAPDDLKKITGGLDAHARASIGISWELSNIISKDKNGNMIGGLVGFVAGNSFMVNLLWVDENHRKTGLGRALMKNAEIAAKKNGCSQIRVDTYAYQAPDFYQKLGYQLVTTIPNFVEGQDRLFFRKEVK